MTIDLLSVVDHEPPMGDLFTRRRLDTARAVWAEPLAGEDDLPKKRILHQRVVRLHGPARLHRLGVRRGPGYHKCGSRLDLDWVSSLRVLGYVDGQWQVLIDESALTAPCLHPLHWLDLRHAVVTGVILQVRRSGIDDGWSPWNLAMSAFILEGELLAPLAPRGERLLTLGQTCLEGLPPGVRARRVNGEVRYETSLFDVGFHLGRPGTAFLSLKLEEPSRAGANLLNTAPPLYHQGVHLHVVGEAPAIAPSVRCEIHGVSQVQGAQVLYEVTAGGQHYDLQWSVTAAGLELRVVRTAEREQLAWHSCAWVWGIRNSATPPHLLGEVRREGETGGLSLPVLLNLPGFGTWEIDGTGDGWVRSECVRERDLNLLEFKVGEEPTPEGLYRLPAGRYEAVFRFRPRTPPLPLQEEAPAVVRRALERTLWTALTFRADTATLSNNGASIHCPICMDTWAAVALPQERVVGRTDGAYFLRATLERWLNGGPGYAAGRLLQDGQSHDADDEYLMTGASALRGLGDFLCRAADESWFCAHRPQIQRRLAAARARDLDGDGLIESPYRTGESGTGQWSTCWFDVISFGWKDAFANAILHGALDAVAKGLERFGEQSAADELWGWRDQLQASYRRTFWNDETGWLAGWRCRADRLHDYAFLPVNGAAITGGLLERDEAQAVLRRLLAEARRVGLPDARYGLPGNLRPIASEDLPEIMQGYPMGYYQNGGRTHAQTRHFVMALYQCGFTAEADHLLERLCVGLAEAAVIGGNQSGVDWRYWDDRPCGYEGLLTDQFGVIEPILWRWGHRAEQAREALAGAVDAART